MQLEERNKKSSAYRNFSMTLDFSMAIMYNVIAGFIYFKPPPFFNDFSKTNVLIISVVISLYGFFRLYRAWMAFKNK
ncbi:MAG: hypothetical protein KA275_05805 [Chitinophagaceae bacterium]|nr:hypothetical protein [Chitinophagaceae bacterium]